MAKRNFSKFQSLYNQSMIDISLINNNQLNQFYTIPYGTKSVLFFTIYVFVSDKLFSFLLFKVTSSSSNLLLISDLKLTSSEL